jgi:aryl-alcohol dehydrogenase-like predicted oxidoreductase
MGFGLMGLSGFYGPLSADDERFAVLDRAVELGATNWDTADMYMDSEDLVGKWFARTGKRDEIFLATKFANQNDGEGNWWVDSSAKYCREACEKSLKRLGVEYVDLYYMHRTDGKTPIEETVREMVKLKK